MCADGTLKPHAKHLILKSHVRAWGGKTFCQIEIEGFVADSVLRLAGRQVKLDKIPAGEEERKKALETLEPGLVKFLRETFRDCEITVSPATFLNLNSNTRG